MLCCHDWQTYEMEITIKMNDNGKTTTPCIVPNAYHVLASC